MSREAVALPQAVRQPQQYQHDGDGIKMRFPTLKNSEKSIKLTSMRPFFFHFIWYSFFITAC